jgi:alkylation response protein AidB-like acyl-CoA dehydrogenase
MLHGADTLRDRVLPPVVAGEQQASYCLSEPNSGSDAASMTTRRP